jgi:hypothetical protein
MSLLAEQCLIGETSAVSVSSGDERTDFLVCGHVLYGWPLASCWQCLAIAIGGAKCALGNKS